MKSQKHLFSLDPDVHYLNCATKAPLLKSSEQAAIQALVRERNPQNLSADDFFRDVAVVKSLFGKLVGCGWDEAAFIPAVSYGFSSIVPNIVPKTSGHAITVKDEFPSGVFALQRWCREHDQQLLTIDPDFTHDDPGRDWNERLIGAINDHTTMVLISAVHWMNGTRYNLREIGACCHEVGAKLLVDGTQTIGALPFNVKEYNVDVLVCAAYKCMFGPYSTGFMYVSEDFYHGKPMEESWMNRLHATDFSGLTRYEENYQPKAARYNMGESSHFILIPMLNAALEQLMIWGPDNIQEYCKGLISPLLDYLGEEKKESVAAHLYGVKLPDDVIHHQLMDNLRKHKVSISVRGEFLRVSTNVFNEEADIAALIQSIDESRKHRRR